MATQIYESRPPAHGQQHSYSLFPHPPLGCRVTWQINGRYVFHLSEIGGLRVVGDGLVLTVEVIGDTRGTQVSAITSCDDRHADHDPDAGPITVGAGSSVGPCESPACVNAIADYRTAVEQAILAKRHLRLPCLEVDFFMRLFLAVVIVLAMMMATIAACNVLGWSFVLCVSLYIVATVIAAAIATVAASYLRARRSLHKLILLCEEKKYEMWTAYLDMFYNCRPECRLPKVDVDCSC